jgi:colanic acid/amylovoran biosynthesis protein
LFALPKTFAKLYLNKIGFGMFDMVIVAGGHHFSDIECGGYPGFAHELLPICLAYKCGIPFIITGSTIGPIKDKFARFITKRLLEKAREINLRDEDSKRYLVEVVRVKNNIKVKADWAFLVEPSLKEHCRDESAYRAQKQPATRKIAIIVRTGINYVGSVEDESYLNKIARVADSLIEEMGVTIVLFPQTITSIRGQNDLQACSRVQGLMKNNVIVSNTINWTVDQILSFYRNMDLIITCRMHAIILSAVAGGVPVIAIAHSYKFHGLMKQMGLEEFVLPITSFAPDDLIDLVSRALTESVEIKRRISNSLPKMKRLALENLESVFQI